MTVRVEKLEGGYEVRVYACPADVSVTFSFTASHRNAVIDDDCVLTITVTYDSDGVCVDRSSVRQLVHELLRDCGTAEDVAARLRYLLSQVLKRVAVQVTEECVKAGPCVVQASPI